MNGPKTLLEISGASENKVDWDNAAVILIDFQMEYINGELTLENKAMDCIEKAQALVDYARFKDAPVFHVVQHGASGGKLFNPDSVGVDIVPEIKTSDNDTVVIKSLPNAFANTNLQELLESTDKTELIYAGFMSHMCVSSSVRASLDLGYRNFVCSDACYSRELRNTKGNTIPAEMVHEVAMAALRDRFAVVQETSEITKNERTILR